MKISAQKAINLKCKECIYDPIGGGGTWREQIAGCTSYSCPLFNHRPVDVNTKKKQDSEYLSGLSLEDREIVLAKRAFSAQTLAVSRENSKAM